MGVNDYKHHIMMYNYYMKRLEILEAKIFKIRYRCVHGEKLDLIYVKTFEDKLRDKLTRAKFEIDWHKSIFKETYYTNIKDFPNEYTDEEIRDYVSLFHNNITYSTINNK